MPAILAVMTALAVAENFFPPIPADVLVAFGGFLAARGNHSPLIPFLCVWAGNVGGAIAMYFLGRRLGEKRLGTKFKLDTGGDGSSRVHELYRKYGIAAFFLTRFIPGVRAIVPPIAGAMRIPPTGAIIAIALASAVWYGAITWLAYRAGASWEQLRALVGRFGTWSSGIALALVAVIAIVWWLRRRSRGRSSPPAAS